MSERNAAETLMREPVIEATRDAKKPAAEESREQVQARLESEQAAHREMMRELYAAAQAAGLPGEPTLPVITPEEYAAELARHYEARKAADDAELSRRAESRRVRRQE